MNKSVVKCYRKNTFSLIEILVALMIIAVCFTVFMQALSLNIKNTGIAKNYISANLLATKKLVEITTNDKLKVEKKEGEFGDSYPGFKWELNIKEQTKYLFSIKLTISFGGGGNTRKIIFKTLSINKKALKKKSKDKKNTTGKSSNKNDSSGNSNNSSTS